MSLLILAAATQAMSLPVLQPGRLDGLLSGYRGSSVVLELFLDPDGKVLECAARGGSLSDEARARLCEHAIGRDFYHGARGLEGEPVHAAVSMTQISRTDYEEGNFRDRAPEPDFEVLVSSMPGSSNRRTVHLVAYIDDHGAVVRCQRNGDDDVQLAAIACTQSAAHRFGIRRNADGVAVPYVGVLRIDFVRE